MWTERRSTVEESLLKRVMPHSTEAEQSVIGAMILDRDAVTVASEMLSSEDFYQKQYGILFDAMTELYSEGKPIDLITLQNRLKEKDVPPEVSSLEFVRDLITADFCECKVLCGDRVRKSTAAAPDQGQRRYSRGLLCGKRKRGGDTGKYRKEYFSGSSAPL